MEEWPVYKMSPVVSSQCVYEDKTRAGGVTSMRMSGNRVMVARLSGVVDMLLLEAATTVTTPASTPTAAPTASPLHHQHADWSSAYPIQQNYQYPRRPGACDFLSLYYVLWCGDTD